MTDEIIESKNDFNDRINNFAAIGIIIMVLVFAFMYNVIVGVVFIIGAYYLYLKLVYKVFLIKDFIKLKYLNSEKKIPLNKIAFLQIVKHKSVITLSLSIKIKDSKKRINFSYGDKENLLKIVNYFESQNIKIIDEFNLLYRYYRIDINDKNQHRTP